MPWKYALKQRLVFTPEQEMFAKPTKQCNNLGVLKFNTQTQKIVISKAYLSAIHNFKKCISQVFTNHFFTD